MPPDQLHAVSSQRQFSGREMLSHVPTGITMAYYLKIDMFE
jgi:hypothetical protein